MMKIAVIMLGATIVIGSCSTQQKSEKDAEADLLSGTHEMASKEPRPVVPAFEMVDAKVKSQINEFLIDYFALNQTLIQDDQNGAKAAARKLSETVKKFDLSKLTAEQMDFHLIQVSKLNRGLNNIADSPDIEKTRLELVPVSESMYALVKAYHANESSLYYNYCPMAKNGEGGNWLSGTKEIINPYMGQMMLECGRIEEILH